MRIRKSDGNGKTMGIFIVFKEWKSNYLRVTLSSREQMTFNLRSRLAITE